MITLVGHGDNLRFFALVLAILVIFKDPIEDSPLKQVMAVRKITNKIINYKYEILNLYCLSKLA